MQNTPYFVRQLADYEGHSSLSMQSKSFKW